MSHTPEQREAYWRNRKAGARGQGPSEATARRVATVQIQHIEPLQERYPDIFTDDAIMKAYKDPSRFIVEHNGTAFYLSKNIIKKFTLKGEQ